MFYYHNGGFLLSRKHNKIKLRKKKLDLTRMDLDIHKYRPL